MFRREDIPESDRLRSPITVTVRDVDDADRDRLDSVVTVEDSVGHTIPLYVWTTHNFTLSWNVGHQYELSDVRGSYWKNQDRYELHSTKDFAVRDCGSPSAKETRLFFIGDTHIGYENRANQDKPNWAHGINTIGAFEDALGKAESLDVDAVVHAGDIFDHDVSEKDLDFARDTLIYERRGTLPFYYIYGNHDWKSAKTHMQQLADRYGHVQRLTCRPKSIGDPTVDLFGVNHLQGGFHDVSLQSTQSQGCSTILVIHESPYPATNNRTSSKYQKDGVDLDLAIADSSVKPDLIVCGHMHRADQTYLEESEIPVIVTGPTVPISKVDKQTPCGWLVTVSESGLEVARQPL